MPWWDYTEQNKRRITLDRCIWRSYGAAATSFLLLRGESIPDLRYVMCRMEVVYSLRMQLFLGRGRFTHKVPEFILHQSSWESKQDEASPFPKEQMPKKKQMMGAMRGVESDKEASSINQRWAQLEAITQWDVWRRSWKQELPILPRQRLTKCLLMKAGMIKTCGWLCMVSSMWWNQAVRQQQQRDEVLVL